MKKFIIVFTILSTLLISWAIKKDMSETPEQKEARIAAWEASKHHEYEIVSVSQYIKTETNGLGAVIKQEPAFYFTYIGDDGQIHDYKDYTYSNYGLRKLAIGDTNKFVIEDGFDTYMWLYLTKDTMNNIGK